MSDELYGGSKSTARRAKPLTAPGLRKAKADGRKLAMVTCYDYTFARIVDGCDIDLVLVGDSLGNVIQGQGSTLPVTLDQMVYHSAAVRRGTRAFLVGDMPFMSYQISTEEALRNAARFMAEAHCNAVKLEGGAEYADTVRRLVEVGIPVMGHLGLTPQSVNVLGGNRVQGKTRDAAEKLKADALALQDAGACSLVLELVPADLAREVTASLDIPTIGIGAGPHCDGQVLVLYDLLGMNADFNPKFLRKYADLSGEITSALDTYAAEVRGGTFPTNDHSF